MAAWLCITAHICHVLMAEPHPRSPAPYQDRCFPRPIHRLWPPCSRSRAERKTRTVPGSCAPGSAISFQNILSIRCGFGINFRAPHEIVVDEVQVLHLPSAARFRTSLKSNPDNPALRESIQNFWYPIIIPPYAFADQNGRLARQPYSLTQRQQCPAQSLQVQEPELLFIAAFFVVDNFSWFWEPILPNENLRYHHHAGKRTF